MDGSYKESFRDNDKKFGKQFSAVAKNSGIKELKTPIAAPRANALCERFIGSLRRECLDHFIIFNPKQGGRSVSQYKVYYNQQRPHQSIQQRQPIMFTEQPRVAANNHRRRISIMSTPILSGLHHSYEQAAIAC